MASMRQMLERSGRIVMLGTLLIISQPMQVAAEETEEEAKVVPVITYTEMKPAFVLNLASEATNGRLSFAKVEVSLRSASAEAAGKADKHMPALRHTIVMLLSRQSADIMGTPEGQEAVRQEALKSMQDILKKEEGDPAITDLLFTTFVVQR